MAPIRYSLHYEDYSEHLMSRFGKLLQMQSLVDMTLMCSSHTLRVHKAVLAASSAYFQEVLQKQMGEPLIILKMRFSVLKCLVEFMYCGKTQCLEENLDELVSAAQFLKIKGLSKVTKEGLGISNSGELPVFTPPVVINRPPQSLIDQHSQDNEHKSAPSPLAAATSGNQPMDAFGRPNKQDTLVRIPFDIENGGSSSTVDYADLPRSTKPRRGRPSARRSCGWEGPGSLSRAAERALLRREQDSRKAIHQLKHLQTRHMQDYMDRMSLSQAVNSICGPESSNNYMNIDNDLMYMDQNVTSNELDPNLPFKDNIPDNIPSSYSNTSTANSTNDNSGDGISTAMSQYVNALKSAGLPTDLPILFESGDGSYINVNEQVLLDMVQSSEIQYEVIEQPNIIEKVADPSEIKSIDDLSKSIERGEMILGNKGYSQNDYTKDQTQFHNPEDSINGLNTILPDNLESFGEQQNYVVLDRLQENANSLDHVNANDFSCIDGDMQYFKSMSDDVKKYYEDQQLSDARVMEQLCPNSSSLETNFNMSILDAKSSQMNESLNQQFTSLNTEAMRRSEDCYDFSLQLPQSNVFKDDLDCLIATPRRNDDDSNSFAKAKEEIIKDLMSIESKMNMSQKIISSSANTDGDMLAPGENTDTTQNMNKNHSDLSTSITTSGLQWDGLDINDEPCRNDTEDNSMMNHENDDEDDDEETEYEKSVMNSKQSTHDKSEKWNNIINGSDTESKETEHPKANENLNSDLENEIPYAVGLLPMKHAQQTEESSLLKRNHPSDLDLLDNVDAKCLKRKAKKM